MKLLFLVVGTSNRDPLPALALVPMIQELSSRNVPVSYVNFREGSDITLQQDISNYEININLNGDIVRALAENGGEIKDRVMQANTVIPAFSIEPGVYQALGSWVINQYLIPKNPEAALEMMMTGELDNLMAQLLSYSGHVGKLQLCKKLKSLGIGYMGIGANPYNLQSSVDDLATRLSESDDSKSEDGAQKVVICDGMGYYNAPLIGAYLLEKYQNAAEVEVRIVLCESAYCRDSFAQMCGDASAKLLELPAEQRLNVSRRTTNLALTDGDYAAEWDAGVSKALFSALGVASAEDPSSSERQDASVSMAAVSAVTHFGRRGNTKQEQEPMRDEKREPAPADMAGRPSFN